MTDDNRDRDIKIAEEIAATRVELDQAREVVRNLANELADVADVIEPVLSSHVKRLREARMASLDELRQISNAIHTLTQLLTSQDTSHMLAQAERFLHVCREVEEFRACGFLDAWVRLLAEVPR